MTRRLICVAASLLCLASSLSSAFAEDGYRVEVTEGARADILRPDGEPILRYMFERDTSNPERTFDTAKVFAHVMAPGGEKSLTKGAGGTFPHHRGIFIGWNRIEHGGKRHDLWHVRDTAQQHRKFLETEGDENGGTIRSEIAWIGVDGEPVISEKRTYRVVASSDAYAVIDFLSELTAVGGDVKLDGDPEHAGVQFRPSQEVADNKSASYVFHEAGVDPKKDKDLPWVALSFRIGDQAWTVQHMSHPSNPKGAVWSAYRDYGRFGPFPTIEIADGETVTLQYRFRVTKGEAPSRERLAESYEAFAK